MKICGSINPKRPLTTPNDPNDHTILYNYSDDKHGKLSNASDLEGDRDKALYLLWDALIARARGVGTKTSEGASAPSGEGSLKHLNGLEAGSSFDICWKHLRSHKRTLRAHDLGHDHGVAAAAGGEAAAGADEGVSGPENEETASGKAGDGEGEGSEAKGKKKRKRRKEGGDEGVDDGSMDSSDVSSDEEDEVRDSANGTKLVLNGTKLVLTKI